MDTNISNNADLTMGGGGDTGGGGTGGDSVWVIHLSGLGDSQGPQHGQPLVVSGTLQHFPQRQVGKADFADFLVEFVCLDVPNLRVVADLTSHLGDPASWSASAILGREGRWQVTASSDAKDASDTGSVVIPDLTPPSLSPLAPSEGSTISIDDTGRDIEVRVRVEDPLGVASVSAQLDNGPIQLSIASGDDHAGVWSGWVRCSSLPLGRRTIDLTATDFHGNLNHPYIIFVAADYTVPAGRIVKPDPNSRYLLAPGTTTCPIPVHLQATDLQSGVAHIVCELLDVKGNVVAGQSFTQDYANPPTVDWSGLTLVAPASGWYSVRARFWDKASLGTDNFAEKLAEHIEVADRIAPLNPNDLVGPNEYLRSLLRFVKNHALLADGNPVTDSNLLLGFGQDFGKLATDTSAAGTTPLNQARLCVVVLRGQLADTTGMDTTAPGVYLLAAYQQLLRQIGTSHQELRLAQGASVTVQAALAAKLGLGSDVGKLRSLTLHETSTALDSTLSEETLRRLFGLAAPQLASDSAAGDLYHWQINQLHADWAEGDRSLPILLIDPDVIGKADLASSTSDAAYQAWATRRSEIAARDAQLRALRDGQSGSVNKFNAMLDDVLATDSGAGNALAKLRNLQERATRGEQIGADLAVRFLDPSSLQCLLRVAALAETGEVTEAEWEDVIAILLGIWKARRLAAWRQEETTGNIALSPRFFALYNDELPAMPSSGFKDGVAVLRGNDDLNWAIEGPAGSGITGQPKVAALAPTVWVPDDDRSRWLAPEADGNTGVAPGIYTYLTMIDLDGWDLSTVELVVKFAVDNQLLAVTVQAESGAAQRIELTNGLGTYTAFTSLSIDGSKLQAGVNRLGFEILNAGSGPNPSGFRVEFQFARPPRRLRASPWRIVAPSVLPKRPPLPNTGVADGIIPVPGGLDPNWKITAVPAEWPADIPVLGTAFVFADLPAPWLPNSDGSFWIGPGNSGNAGYPLGDYIYETTLDLSGWNPSPMVLDLRVAADDRVASITVKAGDGPATEIGSINGFNGFTTLRTPPGLLIAGRNIFRFQVTNEGSSANPAGLRVEFFYVVPPAQPNLEWHPLPTARSDWQDKLAGRLDQASAFWQSAANGIQAVEQATLPLLRDTLIGRFARLQNLAPSDAAECLGLRFLIETRGDAWRLTTPVLQATESLQTLVQALREESISNDPGHPAKGWRLAFGALHDVDTQDGFDEEWDWMGGYEAWRSAMLMFCFPENLLLPRLRPAGERSGPFNDLVNALGAKAKISRKAARGLTQGYLAALSNDRMLAFWPCNEGQGAKLSDHNGTKNDGDIIHAANGPAWVGGDPRVGLGSGALRLDDQTVVEIPDADAFHFGERESDFTIAVRVNIDANNQNAELRLIQKGLEIEPKVGFGLWLRQAPDDTTKFNAAWVGDTETTYHLRHWSAKHLSPGTWYHLALSRVGDEMRLYIDGELAADASAKLPGKLQDNKGILRIGGSDGMPMVSFRGAISDVRIFDYALVPWMLRNIAGTGRSFPPAVLDTIVLSDTRTDTELDAFRARAKEVWTATDTSSEMRGLLAELWYYVPMAMALQLQKSGEYEAALDWYRSVYVYSLREDDAGHDGERKIFPGLADESNQAPTLDQGDHWLRDELNPHEVARLRVGTNPYTRFTLMSVARCFIEYADAEFAQDSGEALANARQRYLAARRLLLRPDLDQVQPTREEQVLLPNPVLNTLRLRIDNQLRKLRQGRNAAGMKREIEVPAPPTTLSGIPTIGSGGQLVIPGGKTTLNPTPYRFAVLMERAKQLAGIAQQVESAYLSSLEKTDQENYNLKRARYDLNLATAGMALQKLRLAEARTSKRVAEKQKFRATRQKKIYDDRLAKGLSEFEESIFGDYSIALAANITKTTLGGTISVLQPLMSVGSAITPWDKAYNAGLGLAIGGITVAQTIVAIEEAVAENAARLDSLNASYERRAEEWQMASDLAGIDEQIGDQQIQFADDHINVTQQEQAIAELQNDQAKDVANFLATKFTNAELYEWMSGVLGGVYSYFLQQATAVGRLAQDQLAFERQESPENFIQEDYWEMPSDAALAGSSSNTQDRRGITGSVRLLEDIYKLDQFAFETNKRKLNLMHVLSLSTLFPQEFATFRQTGVLQFNTRLAMFDELFPGHYLRLIKRVRTSVVALIPPVAGIRATLQAGPTSYVVIGGDVFQDAPPKTLHRGDAERVALTSPSNATGVFELDAQSELLMPFESMGVATNWSLSMPKAANSFDFDTIADVLITIEYTALFHPDYQQQVIQRLPTLQLADKSYSIRNDFPDIWYELSNPGGTSLGEIRYRSERHHFPPNLGKLEVREMLFALIADVADPASLAGDIGLAYTPDGGIPVSGLTDATLLDGRASTRSSARSAWGAISGQQAIGEWTFRLPPSISEKIASGEISDILIIESFAGKKAVWPVT